MKNIKRILAIVLAVIMCFSLASCSLINEDDTDITNDNIKIGVLYPGKAELGEGEFNDIATTTTLKSIVSLTSIGYGISGDRFKFREDINPADADASKEAIQSLLNLECNLIFVTDKAYEQYVADFAKENPAVQFVVYNGTQTADNIHSYKANVTGVSYLAGIVAGLKAAELKSNLIGYLVANKNDLTTLNGFAAGAKSVNKDIRISASETDKIADQAEAYIKTGCAIIASDFYSEDIDDVANANNAYYCGFGTDSYTDAAYEGETSYFLCAPMYDFTQCYIDIIKAVVDGTEVKDYNGGYITGSTYLSDIGEGAAKGTVDAVSTAENALENGSLKIELSATDPGEGVTFTHS